MATCSGFLFKRVPTAGKLPRLDYGARTVCLLGLLFFFAGQSGVAADPKLTVEVLRGANGNNNAFNGTSVSPVVRVKDASGKPVSGALVVFYAPPEGPSVNFAGAGAVAQAVSDESGVAIAPHFVPTGDDGPVEIRVLATKEGASFNLSIFQMNLGVRRAAAPSDELDLLGFVEVSTLGRKGPAVRIFQVFAGDGPGRPVAGAKVLFSVRTTEKGPGKWEPLDPLQPVSGPDGLASALMHKKSGHTGVLEFSVTATVNGKTATRYFTRDH
jgi:hypothetical protein